MKSYLKLFVAVFFILAAVKAANADNYTVSGKVRYADNNAIVTSGQVRLYDDETYELVAVGEIQPTGDYLLGVVRSVHSGDIIGLPNVEPEMDWVPTCYPDAIDPQNMVRINVNQNLTGVDIYVQRTEQPGGSAFFTKISGLILDNNNKPVSGAIVYTSLGENYIGFGISDSKGNYVVNNVPLGNVNLAVHRMGSSSAYNNVYVTENGLFGVNFKIEKLSGNTNAPIQYKLSQNYPNPFNPVTNIGYSIPVKSQVTIKVYNSLGQLTSTLVNEVKEAGSYEASFNAGSIASGVYYYRIVAGNYSETKKMTLIK